MKPSPSLPASNSVNCKSGYSISNSICVDSSGSNKGAMRSPPSTIKRENWHKRLRCWLKKAYKLKYWKMKRFRSFTVCQRQPPIKSMSKTGHSSYFYDGENILGVMFNVFVISEAWSPIAATDFRFVFVHWGNFCSLENKND